MSSTGNAPDIIELLPIDEDFSHGENHSKDAQCKNGKDTSPTRKQKIQQTEKKTPGEKRVDASTSKTNGTTTGHSDELSNNKGKGSTHNVFFLFLNLYL